MQIHRMSILRLIVSIGFMLLVSGCFQPAGAGLEATDVTTALPTFTPVPTDTPTTEPTPFPSFTPEDLPLGDGSTLTPSETDDGVGIAILPTESLEGGTRIAQGIDPIWQTATAIYLEQIGDQGGAQPPTDDFPIIQEPTLDLGIPVDPGVIAPEFQTATQIIIDSTATAAFPLTQTAQALFQPTFTATFEFPTLTPTIQQGQQGPVLSGEDCIHEVQPTDRNLFRIGLAYGVPYIDIARATPVLYPDLIYVGQKLVIPGCGTTGKIPPPTSTPSQPYFPNTQVPPGPTPTSQYAGQTYTVIWGDTLYELSLLWGTTVNEIAARNPEIYNVNLIFVGQELVVP